MKLLPARPSSLGFALLLPFSLASAAGTSSREVAFQKLTLTSEYWCDGVNAADINGDGKLDVVAGPFWYAGPDGLGTQVIAADVNGDKIPDVLNASTLGTFVFLTKRK